MKIRPKDMEYLAAFLKKMETAPHLELEPYITSTCPECSMNSSADDYFTGIHATYSLEDPDGYLPKDDDIVLIGCEGYHIINPNLLDLPRESWDDWTDYLPE